MTHFNTRIMAVASVALLGMTAWVCAEAGPGKKLIEYGWDVRSPAYVVEHIREMEKPPSTALSCRRPPTASVMSFITRNWTTSRRQLLARVGARQPTANTNATALVAEIVRQGHEEYGTM